MDVYVDASVVLRVLGGEANALPTWTAIDRPMSSELLRVECLRSIDRARVRFGLMDTVVAERRAAIIALLGTFALVPVSGAVLERASEPFPTAVGSLDAIHLATAVLLRDQIEGLRLATHDLELGLAARSVGFEVDGLSV